MNSADLRFLIQRLFAYKSRFITAILFMFLFSIFNTSVIFIVKTVIDDVFVNARIISEGGRVQRFSLKRVLSAKGHKPDTEGVNNGSVLNNTNEAKRYLIRYLLIISFIFVLITLLKGMFWYIRKYMMLYIAERSVYDIRSGVYSHLQDLSVRYFDKSRTGEIMSRLTNDVMIIQQTLGNNFTQMTQEPLIFILSLGVLFYLNFTMTLISLLAVLLLIYPVSILSKKMKRSAKISQEKIGDLNSIMQEILSGIRIVKAFNMEKRESEKFRQVNREYFNAAMKGNRAWALLTPSNEFLAAVAVSFAIIIGGIQVANGEMTTGAFFAYFFALYQLYRPTRTMMEALSSIRKSLPSVKRVREILSEKIEIKEMENPVNIQDFKEGIVFEDVSFTYDTEYILNNVEIKIKKGQTVAFVGESGAGKSTILSLLLRFYDVQKGRILIDGIDIRDYRISDLRSLIGYVSQETFLFNDTVKANIVYGKDDIDDKKIEAATLNSGAKEFIERLPQGYNTIIGERGVSLSGGQRQRIAIARALIKDPQILLLDEATSSLDLESEQIVQKALNILMKGRTNIIVAHRLSTVINSDLIMVMEKGNIVEIGDHQTLLDRKGIYHRLYDMK